MLNKKCLGTTLLTLTKGANEMLADDYHNLRAFAVVNNGTNSMICFTVEEYEGYYFWASSLLTEFFNDNIENAKFDPETLSYSFPEDLVEIKHGGKVPVKSDPSKTVNVWLIRC